jgi:hypothetical protein
MSQRGVRCLLIKTFWYRGPVIKATETCKEWKIKTQLLSITLDGVYKISYTVTCVADQDEQI